MNHHKRPRALPWIFHPLEFSLCGYCDSGKTTLMVAVVEYLSQKAGLSIGYVKHDAHRFQMDREGKDTDRVAQAGAASVYISNDVNRAQLRFGTGKQAVPHLEFLDCDAVMVEGFKQGALAKLCVLDSAMEILAEPGLHEHPPVAYAGPWTEAPEGIPTGLPYFCRDKTDEIATFILDYWKSLIAGRKLRGLVLTGGASTRMGRDKAALAYHGQSQSLHAFTLLQSVCDEAHISCRADQSDLEGRAGLPQIHDRYVGLGPLGGILSAMDSFPNDSWMVVACDLPFLDQAALKALRDQRNPWRFATSFQGDGDFPEPLLSIYEPKSRAQLFQFLAMGYDCPRKMLINSPITLVSPQNPRTVQNVNDAAEFDEVHNALRG